MNRLRKHFTLILSLNICISFVLTSLNTFAQKNEQPTPYTEKILAINIKYIGKLFFNKNINKPEDFENYLTPDEQISMAYMLSLGDVNDNSVLLLLLYGKASEYPGGTKIIESYVNEIKAAAKLKNEIDIERENKYAEIKAAKEKTKALENTDYSNFILEIKEFFSYWNEKGEFEKKEEWNQRLRQESVKMFSYVCNTEVSNEIKEIIQDDKMSLKSYDADGGYFYVMLSNEIIEDGFNHNLYLDSLKLKIPITEAREFKIKMEDKHFFNKCFHIPEEATNYILCKFNILPKEIVFYNLEVTDLSDISNNELDSIKRLNPWGAPKYVINVLENIDTNEIEDIIIYFDDLGIENPYLKGSYYNYTKQKFYQNPETAKLIAEEEARLQKRKAEQEQQRINDSIFQQADSILQSAIEDYHRYLKQLPYDTIENRITLSIPDSLNGKKQKLSETLNWLLDTVQSKKAEIATRYTNDSIIFSKYNDKLHKLTETANARLLAYPYNLQQRTITDELPINLFGKEEELEKALQTKHAEILGMVEQVEEDVYKETRKKYPQDFMEIYYSQHPEQKQRADSAYKECHCDFLTRLSFDLAFFDGTLPECDCREGAYQQLNNLFHSREEFDKAYNLPIDDFKKEIANRERMFLKIIELSNYLAARPQLNLKKATLYDDDAQIRKILKSIDIHRNSYFYAEAIDAVFKNNEMLEQEWEKNGAYFTSKSEMFEYWIGTGYNKELKKRKKEKQ